MDLIAPVPVFNLYNDLWPVYTHHRQLPPAKVSRGIGGEPSFVDGSLLCLGSIVSGAHVERSIIGTSAFIDHDAHVTESIIFPGVHVGAGARLHRCIIDKNVVIPEWKRIGFDSGADDRGVHRERGRHRGRREGQAVRLTSGVARHREPACRLGATSRH